MLQFVCDYCGSVKQPEETWINGVAAENIGTQAARREVVIDPAWRYERVVLPLAVHFCRINCKDQYLAELFQKPASLIDPNSVDVILAADRRALRAKRKPASNVVEKRMTITKRKPPR
jgi:hypothetical protein